MTSANDLALRRALEAAGVEFIDENGGSPGACLQWVGIAGEDDLDAPDIADEPPQRDKSAEVGVAPGSNLEPAPARSSQLRTDEPGRPTVREKLSAEESASAAAHLIQEIQTLPEDDLQPRAIAILKVKNRLLADDAKLVEEAFAARMAAQASSRAAPTTDEPASAPINPVLPQPPASTVSLKRPRGRPRKVSAPIDVIEPSPILSVSVVADNSAPPSTTAQPDAAPAKIEKSELAIKEPRRHLEPMRFVGRFPFYSQFNAMLNLDTDAGSALCLHGSQVAKRLSSGDQDQRACRRCGA